MTQTRKKLILKSKTKKTPPTSEPVDSSGSERLRQPGEGYPVFLLRPVLSPLSLRAQQLVMRLAHTVFRERGESDSIFICHLAASRKERGKKQCNDDGADFHALNA